MTIPSGNDWSVAREIVPRVQIVSDDDGHEYVARALADARKTERGKMLTLAQQFRERAAEAKRAPERSTWLAARNALLAIVELDS